MPKRAGLIMVSYLGLSLFVGEFLYGTPYNLFVALLFFTITEITFGLLVALTAGGAFVFCALLARYLHSVNYITFRNIEGNEKGFY